MDFGEPVLPQSHQRVVYGLLHVVGLVDQDTREIALSLVEALQLREEVLVAEPLGTSAYDPLGDVEEFRLDESKVYCIVKWINPF